MILGFHYHEPAAPQDGRIRTSGPQGRFLDSLARHCEQVVCFLHTPRADEEELLDYTLASQNVELVPIGPHASVPRRLALAWMHTVPVRQWRSRLDAILIRGPSPLLPAVARAAAGVPAALLLVSDYTTGTQDLAGPRWRKRLIRAWALWNQRQQNRVAARSLTFVNSHELYAKFQPIAPALVETTTTTLTSADLWPREDTCLTPPYRLLYTGRMARAKGILDLAEAAISLVESGEDVVVDLVGPPERSDSALEEVLAMAAGRGLAGRVRYHGYRALGPELFAFYREADVYVMPSHAEGFPRAVWEAMAHGLPVVATRVGSIPHVLEGPGAAQLVDPGDSYLLAEAISNVIHDGDRRRGLIQKGLTLARANTLEARAAEMVVSICEWIGTNHAAAGSASPISSGVSR